MTTVLLLLFLQAPSPASYQLAAVNVTGTTRYSAAEVQKLSGLVSGASVTLADLQAAANRLGETGLFTRVDYRYTTKGTSLTVIFQVEEPASSVPVVFDNFVWFTDDELAAVVRKAFPAFDGTVPAGDAATELLVRTLQDALAARRVPGRVEVNAHAVLGAAQVRRYVFTVRDPAPALCALQFEGASAIASGALVAALPDVLGAPYSRSRLIAMHEGTLTNQYRRRGHWRASFGIPVATVAASSSCNGAAVTVAVSEGNAYMWNGAEWSGLSALPADRLNAALALRSGEVADVSKIDDGLLRVNLAYGKQGYIQQRSTYEPRLDDRARTATFAITVQEGPQFRMGNVEFAGLSERDAANLKKKWALRPGDVYDDSYPLQFQVAEILGRLPPSVRSSIETKVDEDARTVDLRFVVK